MMERSTVAQQVPHRADRPGLVVEGPEYDPVDPEPTMAPAHIAQGSRVTTRCSRPSATPFAEAAAEMAMSSAWPSGSASTSRLL